MEEAGRARGAGMCWGGAEWVCGWGRLAGGWVGRETLRGVVARVLEGLLDKACKEVRERRGSRQAGGAEGFHSMGQWMCAGPDADDPWLVVAI